MFGVSFTELILIGAVALIVVGPQRLPGMMANVGKWSSKLRRMLFDVRQQSGIDDILRAEGITGGINEIRALRNAVRGNVQSLAQSFTRAPTSAATTSVTNPPAVVNPQPASGSAIPPVATTALAAESDPYTNVPYDRSREYPDEGCDAYGAIPDDLWAATQRPVKPVEPPPESLSPLVEGAAHASAGAELVGNPDAVTAAPSIAPPADAVPLPADATNADGETDEARADRAVATDAQSPAPPEEPPTAHQPRPSDAAAPTVS